MRRFLLAASNTKSIVLVPMSPKDAWGMGMLEMVLLVCGPTNGYNCMLHVSSFVGM